MTNSITRHVTRLVVAAAAALGWTPFVAAPLSPDEGGFLMVASQWRPGGSPYGHYWVDRPANSTLVTKGEVMARTRAP